MQRDYIGYILAVISLIVGIIVSWHYYEKGRQFKAPALVLDFFPSTIYDAVEEYYIPLKVLKSDGSNLTKSVHVARHIFWNHGNQPIMASDILTPIKVSMSINAEILSVSISEVSREVASCEVEQEKKNVFLIKFKILEYGDGCAIKIFYSGDKYPKYTISGDIIGVKNIELISETWNDRVKINKERQKFNVIPNLDEAPVVIGFAAFGIVFVLYMRTRSLPKKKFYVLTILNIVLVGLLIYASDIVVTKITSVTYSADEFETPNTSSWASAEKSRSIEEWPMLKKEESKK